MPETYYTIPKDKHDSLVTKAYLKRGYDAAEAAASAMNGEKPIAQVNPEVPVKKVS